VDTVLKASYDVVVCGAGSSGSVIARRIAENADVEVLLLEAGGAADDPAVTMAGQWPTNLGSERDWNFPSEPDDRLGGRAISFSMGKVLGGGSSINLMVWARGHRQDWDYFAAESGERSWAYDAVQDLYRSIEDWHGAPEASYRGSGGPVFVQPAPDPHSIGAASLAAAREVGIPTFSSPNGRLMEEGRGAAIADLRRRGDRRLSVFDTYTRPYLDAPNLTVLPHALVTRVLFNGSTAVGVEVLHGGAIHVAAATTEVILAMGAMHSPKVLMQSGIGERDQLQRNGITTRQHLPGVGQNFHDHFGFDCVWELPDDSLAGSAHVAATMFWDTGAAADDGPDMFACMGPFPKATPENAATFGLPPNAWVLFGAPTHPKSRGHVTLSGPRPQDPIRVESNALSHPDDLESAIACVETLRAIGNAPALRPYVKREVMPGDLTKTELHTYLRNGVTTYWHAVGTAKMGRDAMSVVDGRLRVYGVDRLRVADASIMPRITSANTMAPCVVIGERAAQFIKDEHGM
jgi:choline dehydrogenase-like flavoprotein